MQLHKITPMAWNPLGVVFRENTEQTQRLKLLFSKLVDRALTALNHKTIK
jgi:predicted oxidoreductase